MDDLNIERSLVPLFLLYRATMEEISAGTAAVHLSSHGFERHVSSASRILRSLETKGYIATVAGKNGRPTAYRATRRGRAELSKARTYIRDLVTDIPRATPASRSARSD